MPSVAWETNATHSRIEHRRAMLGALSLLAPRSTAIAQAVGFTACLPVLASTALHLQAWHALSPFHQEHLVPLLVLVPALRVSAPSQAITAACAAVITTHHLRLAGETAAAPLDSTSGSARARRRVALLGVAAVVAAYPLVVATSFATAALLGRTTLGIGVVAYARVFSLGDAAYGLGSALVMAPLPPALALWGRLLWGAPLPLLGKLLVCLSLLVALSLVLSLAGC